MGSPSELPAVPLGVTVPGAAAPLHHLQKSLSVSALQYGRDQVVQSGPSPHELLDTMGVSAGRRLTCGPAHLTFMSLTVEPVLWSVTRSWLKL